MIHRKLMNSPTLLLYFNPKQYLIIFLKSWTSLIMQTLWPNGNKGYKIIAIFIHSFYLNYTINIHYTGQLMQLYKGKHRWAGWRRKKGFVKNSWMLSVCSGNMFCVNSLDYSPTSCLGHRPGAVLLHWYKEKEYCFCNEMKRKTIQNSALFD